MLVRVFSVFVLCALQNAFTEGNSLRPTVLSVNSRTSEDRLSRLPLQDLQQSLVEPDSATSIKTDLTGSAQLEKSGLSIRPLTSLDSEASRLHQSLLTEMTNQRGLFAREVLLRAPPSLRSKLLSDHFRKNGSLRNLQIGQDGFLLIPFPKV